MTRQYVDNEEDVPYTVRTEGPLSESETVDRNMCCLEFAGLDNKVGSPLRFACDIVYDDSDAFFKVDEETKMCEGAGLQSRSFYTVGEEGSLVYTEGPYSVAGTLATAEDCCRNRVDLEDDPRASFCQNREVTSVISVSNVYDSDNGVCNEETSVEITTVDVEDNVLSGPSSEVRKVAIDKGFCCEDRAESEANKLACTDFAIPRTELVFEENTCKEKSYETYIITFPSTGTSTTTAEELVGETTETSDRCCTELIMGCVETSGLVISGGTFTAPSTCEL